MQSTGQVKPRERKSRLRESKRPLGSQFYSLRAVHVSHLSTSYTRATKRKNDSVSCSRTRLTNREHAHTGQRFSVHIFRDDNQTMKPFDC